jgi:hypothetical protein
VVVCPHCHAELELGALRCKACGKDARGASPSPVGIGLRHLIAEVPRTGPIGRALDITDRLEQLSPAFYKWLMASDAPRWENAPSVPEAQREEMRALFDELMEIAHTVGPNLS